MKTGYPQNGDVPGLLGAEFVTISETSLITTTGPETKGKDTRRNPFQGRFAKRFRII